ncbi:MAG: hypothetical protein WKF37_15420 [Bryobacteraceae bacterium]
MFVPLMADTAAADHGNNGRPPGRAVVQDPGVDLAKKTVCIKMRLSTMGNTRKVSTSQIEADADKDLLRVSKHLLDSVELKAIGRFDGEIRRFLYNICLPFEVGIHLLPVAALETVEDRLRKFAEDRQALVTAFLSVYPGLCQDAVKRLRGLYNPADYPPVDEVTREFGLSWQYVSFWRAGPTEGHLKRCGNRSGQGRPAHGGSVVRDPAGVAAVHGRSRRAHGRAAEGWGGRQTAEVQAIDRIESRRVSIELLVPQCDRRSAVAGFGRSGP